MMPAESLGRPRVRPLRPQDLRTTGLRTQAIWTSVIRDSQMSLTANFMLARVRAEKRAKGGRWHASIEGVAATGPGCTVHVLADGA